MHCMFLEACGGRLVIIASAEELMKHFRTTSISEALELLAGLDASSAPDKFSLPSLCMAYVRTNDIVYSPMGSVLIERCMETSVCFRHGHGSNGSNINSSHINNPNAGQVHKSL